MSRRARLAAAGLAALLFASCTGEGTPPGQPAAAPALTDVTEAAGIHFRHESGARGEMLNPETFGPGAGWVDFDGDQRLDLLLVNGNALEGPLDPARHPALYRNLGDGRFADVTAEAGLALPLYGMGFVSADADQDGDQDVLLYGLHGSLFLINDAGKFRETTAAAGLSSLTGWIGAAAFWDENQDGALDLLIGNYVTWSVEIEKKQDCTFGTGKKNYCPVAVFASSSPQHFRGRGDATFEDRTVPAGIARLRTKALGIILEDYDRDGDPDAFIANDTVPNLLLHNRGDGTLEDRGLESGFATGADGAPLAGMGIDSAWLPDGGPLAIAIGNFSGEPVTLHVGEGGGSFVERSFAAGIGQPTLRSVTFGLALEDFNLDGELDLAIANGHVFDLEGITGVPYRQRTQLFWGRDWRRVEGLFAEAKPGDHASFLGRPILGRALATADYDSDGDIDMVITENQGPVHLLRNDLAGPKRFVRVELRGTKSNRDALGAEVTFHITRGGVTRTHRRTRQAASSYLSQPERQISLGVGAADAACDVEVRWPSRHHEVFRAVARDREVLLVEGTGEPLDGTLPASPAAPRAIPQGAPAPAELRRRARERIDAGQPAAAIEAAREATRLEVDDWSAHRLLCIALARAGRRSEALAAAREACARFAAPDLLLSQFAVVLQAQGLSELAELFYREALRLDPRRHDAWMALANAGFDHGELDAAIAHYARALELRPGSLEALTNTGKALTLKKELPGARDYLERALLIDPGHAPALAALGGVLIEEGDLPRAEVLLEQAIPAAKTDASRVTVWGNLGILRLRQRDRRRALECFEKVLELRPDDARARESVERLRRP